MKKIGKEIMRDYIYGHQLGVLKKDLTVEQYAKAIEKARERHLKAEIEKVRKTIKYKRGII